MALTRISGVTGIKGFGRDLIGPSMVTSQRLTSTQSGYVYGTPINEADLDEVFISGSGPGGQSVNKAVNCCQLRHKPTGIVVKVHQTRSLEQNRKIARQLLAIKLDNFYNGDESFEAKKRREALRKISIRESQAEKRRAMKEQYKKILETT
jgi:protein subunit release factor B